MLSNIVYAVLVYPTIFILPAYFANGAPVIFGGGKPIDFGRRFRGKPIFGKHKTIRGLVAGLAVGFIVAAIESRFLGYLLMTGIMLSIGAHFGDLLGSFIKRRIGKREGESWPFFDQYLFLVFALVFALPFDNIPNPWGILFIVILTGVLHRAMNMLSHRARIKEVPW